MLAMGPPPPVALSVSPRNAYSPASLRLRFTINPDKDNREACFVFDSEVGETGLSCWGLDGDDSPRTTTVWFKLYYPDRYYLQLNVRQVNGKILKSDVAIVDVLEAS